MHENKYIDLNQNVSQKDKFDEFISPDDGL